MTYRFSRSAGRSISENDFTLHRRGHEDDQDRKRGESRKHLQCKFFNRCSGRKSYSVMTRLRSFRFDVRRSTEERKEKKRFNINNNTNPLNLCPSSLSPMTGLGWEGSYRTVRCRSGRATDREASDSPNGQRELERRRGKIGRSKWVSRVQRFVGRSASETK